MRVNQPVVLSIVVFGLLVLSAPIHAQTNGQEHHKYDDTVWSWNGSHWPFTASGHGPLNRIWNQTVRKLGESKLGLAPLATATDNRPTLRPPVVQFVSMRRRPAWREVSVNGLHRTTIATDKVDGLHNSSPLSNKYNAQFTGRETKYTQFLLVGGVVTAASIAWWMWDVVSTPSTVATDADNTLLVKPILERRTIGFSSMLLF